MVLWNAEIQEWVSSARLAVVGRILLLVDPWQLPVFCLIPISSLPEKSLGIALELLARSTILVSTVDSGIGLEARCERVS